MKTILTILLFIAPSIIGTGCKTTQGGSSVKEFGQQPGWPSSMNGQVGGTNMRLDFLAASYDGRFTFNQSNQPAFNCLFDLSGNPPRSLQVNIHGCNNGASGSQGTLDGNGSGEYRGTLLGGGGQWPVTLVTGTAQGLPETIQMIDQRGTYTVKMNSVGAYYHATWPSISCRLRIGKLELSAASMPSSEQHDLGIDQCNNGVSGVGSAYRSGDGYSGQLNGFPISYPAPTL